MDKLQGTWVFDKVARIEPTGYITTSWDLVFVSNGKAFKTLIMTGDTENIHLTNQTRSLTYIAENTEDSVYVIRPLYADYTAYMTIEIISKYDEVENADTLLQALTARASFTPNTSEDIHIPMTSAKGVILKTAGRQCDKDIAVTPTLEELTVTENGEYTPSKAGYSKVTVNVESSGGDEIPADKYFEGGYAVVKLPNATRIKEYAFRADNALTDVIMPKVTSIEKNGFYACPNLALTSLPSGLTNISGSAFYTCSSLAISEIPEGVTSIGSYAFHSCTSLTAITFKGTPTSIKSDVFNQCINLKTINVPWAEGAVANAPWGATNATIHYNYTGG